MDCNKLDYSARAIATVKEPNNVTLIPQLLEPPNSPDRVEGHPLEVIHVNQICS